MANGLEENSVICTIYDWLEKGITAESELISRYVLNYALADRP